MIGDLVKWMRHDGEEEPYCCAQTRRRWKRPLLLGSADAPANRSLNTTSDGPSPALARPEDSVDLDSHRLETRSFYEFAETSRRTSR